MAAILIVEDDKHQRLLLEEELRTDGHTTRATGSAQEALASASARMPDLVILDLGLRDMDSLDFLGRLLAMNLHMRVIIYTGYDGRQNHPAARVADAYVLKRSDLGELKGAIHRVLSLRDAGIEPWGLPCQMAI